MKKKIHRILGVVLTLALLSSLAIVAAVPVAAQPGENEWGEIDLPVVAPGTDVDLLAQAADGTLFASVFYDGTYGTTTAEKAKRNTWAIVKSVPNADGIAGFTWKDTGFTKHVPEITAIACAPNWGSNDTVYVADDAANVYRCTDAADDDPILLRTVVGDTPDETLEAADTVYDMDLWYDGSDIWIMVATDLDIMVMRDALFEAWLDMDLSISFDGDHEDAYGDPIAESSGFGRAFVCRFAPDFNESSTIWAILRDDNGYYWIASTKSPGQWGQIINPVEIDLGHWASSDCDLAFSDAYDTETEPLLYAALGAYGSSPDEDLYIIEGGFYTSSKTIASAMLVAGGGLDFQDVEVSGNIIMGSTRNDNEIWISRNNGDTFALASKLPSGVDHTQVLMAPGSFDEDEGVAYAVTRGSESAFSYSKDGGDTWNQIGFVDTTITYVLDLAFSPLAGSQPAAIITDDAEYLGNPESVWYTKDITAASPQWERVLSTWIMPLMDFYMVEFSMDGTSVMLYGMEDDFGDFEIWKSTDNLQTWKFWRTVPSGTVGKINDWVVYDSSTIFTACEKGFFGTGTSGPATVDLIGTKLVSIAVQPGFDPDDSGKDVILAGGANGKAYVSGNAGDDWGTGSTIVPPVAPATTIEEDVIVAFDSLDATKAYFATSGSTVKTGTVSATTMKVTGVTDLLDDGDGKAEVTGGFTGLQVAPDNALYALGSVLAPIESEYTLVYGAVGLETDREGWFGDYEGWGVDGDIELSAPSMSDYFSIGSDDYWAWALVVAEDSDVYDGEEVEILSYNLSVPVGGVVCGTITFTNDPAPVELTDPDQEADGYIRVLYLETPFEEGDVITCDEDGTLTVYDDFERLGFPIVGAELDIEAGTGFSNGTELIIQDAELFVSDEFTTEVNGSLHVQGDTVADLANINDLSFYGDFGFGESDLGDGVDVQWDDLMIFEVVDYGSAEADMYRLLIGEDESVWETAPKDGAVGLWLTEGSNILWTIVEGDSIWALEDTVSGQVKGVAASNILEYSAKISWTAMTGADVYQYKYDSTSKTSTTNSASLSGLLDKKEYSVQVRVAEGEPFTSRWSDVYKFTTKEAVTAPVNLVPVNGMQDAPLLPSFGWSVVTNAVSYEFELGTAPDFTGATQKTTTATFLTWDVELPYDTNHYWRVRAVSSTGTKSAWCASNFHTRVEAIPPVTVPPAPTPTIILPTPQVTVVPPDITVVPPVITVVPPDITVDIPQPTITTVNPVIEMPDVVTPAYIWAIVGIGALLVIAVIVLIIRTRRVV